MLCQFIRVRGVQITGWYDLVCVHIVSKLPNLSSKAHGHILTRGVRYNSFHQRNKRLKVREDKEKLIRLMRKQSSAIRVAYRRLLINLVQNLQGELSECKGANGRNSAWQVLRVAFLKPPYTGHEIEKRQPHQKR